MHPEPTISLYLPSLHGGGAERMMVVLANAISRRGYPVDLVLERAEGTLLEQVSPAVRVIGLAASRSLKALPGLVRYLRRVRPQVVLSTLSNANVIALLARRLSGVSTRLLVREACTNSVLETGPTVVKLMRWTYPWAERVICISNGVAADLGASIGLAASKTTTIYNPAVTPDIFKLAHEPVEHPWLAAGAPPVVMGVGRLTAQKDFTTLIAAFALARRRRDLRLMILGEGPDRAQLEARAREEGVAADVALPGFLKNPYPWMRAARVFVMSSRWEGFGNVLVEAMALNVPVVSTDCPSGPREILQDGRWGRLVPVADAAALSSAMSDVLDVGAPTGAADSVLQRFHSDRITEEYLRLLLQPGALAA